jgi:diguanylate cyclase (GGDEF)-like protein
MKLTKILSLLIFLVSVPLLAVKYPVINYQTADGMPQNQVNALIQDDMGYIIVGTQSGIGKFDGTGFEVITRKHGLPNNFITDFALDNNGNLWVATQEGLCRIDRNNRITTYMTSAFIRSLTVDRSIGTLWVAANNGLYFQERGDFVQYKDLPIINSSDNPQERIIGAAVAKSGRKYFYSRNRIIEIKGKTKRAISSRRNINFVKYLGSLDIFVAGTEDGIFKVSFSDKNLELIPFIELSPQFRNVTDAAVEEYGGIWIGTHEGLLFFKNPGEIPVVFDNENGLPTRQVRKILIDRENNLIIGTQWGMSLLSPHLIKMYDESDGLPYKFVWGYEEDNGSILIACDQGIAQLNPETGKITAFPRVNSTLADCSVRTITKLKDNEFLLGTREHGIFRWNRGSRLENINKDAHVYSAAKTAPRTVWFGTDNGLLKYDGTGFKHFLTGLKDKNVHAIARYDDNTLFLGTGKGVQKFHKETFVPSELEQLIDERTLVNDIKVVSPVEILVATELNGLYIYKDKKLRQITTDDGLLHNDVWSVIKDDLGNIWLNTSVSLDRCSSNGFISHFNRKTGLFGDEGGMHSVLKTESGTIYFGIMPGFIEISALPVSSKIKEPVLYIKRVKVNDELLFAALENNGPVMLKHYQNNLEFRWIAATTRKENPIFYKTRLLPFDTQWTAPTQETRIKYLNLAPENYTFEVMANNGGGKDKWFTSENKITFTIEKPFWLKWWFIPCLVGFGFLLLLSLVKLRLKTLEKQKKHLQELVEERTKELEYLSITDPLTDLKNRRYLEEKIKEDISLIKRSIYESKKQGSSILESIPPILGVFILDIDNFKKVNDDFGHKAGDIVIVEIARILLEMLRNSDTIIRWGGEEFLIITWQREKSDSYELAERMRNRIKEYEFMIDDKISVKKTVSVGFAHFPFITNDIETVNWSHVVSLADSALYIAKNNGRDLCIGIETGEETYTEDTDVKQIVSDIKTGIRGNYLKLISNRKNLEVSQHNI